jgi:hypothetical protein
MYVLLFLPSASKYCRSGPQLYLYFLLPTATTSTTPSGLVAILLASGGNILLPILLSTTQLAVSRHWPDSDIPQHLEQIKVIVNVAGAATTTLVAVVKRWNPKRALAAVEAEAAALASRVVVDATETTALLGGQSCPHLKRKVSKERRVGEDSAWVRLGSDAELSGIA